MELIIVFLAVAGVLTMAALAQTYRVYFVE